MESIKNYLLALGIPGLLVVSVLDSAGVPLPGGVDVAVMLLSWQRPALFFVFSLVAAAGSAAGCLVLYRIARTGGDAMMARFTPERQEWVREKVRQNDTLAVMVAMLGPPPFPTKLFVLVAGVVGMDWRRFAGAVFVGRLARFLGEAYLAVRLGDQAMEKLKEHYPVIGVALVVSVLLFFLVRHVAARRATA
jgi:membrane protein YqaA with SNARE-associated domain